MSGETEQVRERIAAVVGAPLAPRWRGDRWIAGEDGAHEGVVVHVAADERGAARLSAEGELCRRWREAGVPAPRIWAERGGVQVREWLPGLGGDRVEPAIFGGEPPSDRYAADAPLTPFGRRLARSYGELAARIAGVVPAEDPLAGALGRAPFELGACLAALAVTDPALARRLEAAGDWILDIGPADAVVHGDLHFHNLCVVLDGPRSGAITGVFDAGDAGPDTRWADLQYLHGLGPGFVALAEAAYAEVSGRRVDGEAVRRAHLRVALGHLPHFPLGAPRHGSIVAWIRAATVLLPR